MIRVRSQAPLSVFVVLPIASVAPAPTLYSRNPLSPIPQNANPGRQEDGPVFAGKCRPCLVNILALPRSGKPGLKPAMGAERGRVMRLREGSVLWSQAETMAAEKNRAAP